MGNATYERALQLLSADPRTLDIASGLAEYSPLSEGFSPSAWPQEEWGRIEDALGVAERVAARVSLLADTLPTSGDALVLLDRLVDLGADIDRPNVGGYELAEAALPRLRDPVVAALWERLGLSALLREGQRVCTADDDPVWAALGVL